ncbi:MAG: coenzyme PQQ synthesis protein D [Rhodomicrobium sp.]|nr:MAG: coenzyme PQQ synthesis protein D [Rhodomicrobium sp.]
MSRERLIVVAETTPKLPRFVKMRHDKGRDRWIMLAPERILTPDEIAVEVLKLCDGERTVTAIASEMAQTYKAPVEVIEKDIITMLQGLSDKGFLTS